MSGATDIDSGPVDPPPEGNATAITVRVRYPECDPMGLVHHSVYPVWFEMARTELLRRQGISYRDVEAAGMYFVVARLNLRYRRPARYDDQLTVHVTTAAGSGVKLEHEYDVRRDGQQLVTGETTLVCVDEHGRPQPLPAQFVQSEGSEASP